MGGDSIIVEIKASMAAPSICSEEVFVENVAINGEAVVVVVVVEVAVELVSSGTVDGTLTVCKNV